MPPVVPGLCSVTLRARSVPEVAALAASVGLQAVEWGGDVHVPVGDLRAAASARRCSAEAGLTIVSYGSYLQCSATAADHVDAVLDVTEALGTRAVRVWGAHGVEPGSPVGDRAVVVDAAAAVAAAAAVRGLDVYLEFHGGTITASAAAAVALLDEVGAPNLFCAWQPPYWAPQSLDADLADLRALAPRLAHVHVYQWDPDGRRYPLADGSDAWSARLGTVVGGAGDAFGPRAALLEFVTGDEPEAVRRDAATLIAGLSRAEPQR